MSAYFEKAFKDMEAGIGWGWHVTNNAKVVLTKLINSLIALDIAEPHHLKIKELL